MSRIPLDLVFEIFCRLPMKTLLRLRCLSKPFCSLIDGSDFNKLHWNYNNSISTNSDLIVKDSGLFSMKLDSLTNEIPHNYHPAIFGLETEVFGSCHGWLALSNSEQDLFLHNPSTRKLLKLPPPRNDFHHLCNTCVTFFYGFGHDHVNDDYKVVRILRYNDQFTDYEVKVFSLKKNSWTRISMFASCFYFLSDDYCPSSHRKRYAVFVSGVLHWMLPRRRELGSGKSIVAFDLAVEEFRRLPQPDYGDFLDDFALDMGVLKGRLCVICKYDQIYRDVWIMNEHGESWTKLVSIQRSKTFCSFSFFNPLPYSAQGGSDKFLLEVNDEDQHLLLYDLENETIKTVRIYGDPNFFAAYICAESLIPLHNPPLLDTFSRAHHKREEGSGQEETSNQRVEISSNQEEISVQEETSNQRVELISSQEETSEEEISKELQYRKKRNDFLSKGFKRFLYSVTRRCRMGRTKREVQNHRVDV